MDKAALDLPPVGTGSCPHCLSAVGTLGWAVPGRGPRPCSAKWALLTVSVVLLPQASQEAVGALGGGEPGSELPVSRGVHLGAR